MAQEQQDSDFSLFVLFEGEKHNSWLSLLELQELDRIMKASRKSLLMMIHPGTSMKQTRLDRWENNKKNPTCLHFFCP